MYLNCCFFLVSNTLAQVFYFLSEHPEVQTKLYDEIVKEFSNGIDYEKLTQNEYLDAVINESLRLRGSVLLQTRTATVVSLKLR